MKELTEMNSYRLYLLSHLDTGLTQTEKYHDDAKEYSLRMFECAEKMQNEIDRLRAEVERLKRYDDLLSDYFPKDFKDWHQNSKEEWPEVLMGVLDQRDKWIEHLESVFDGMDEEITRLKKNQLKPGEVRAKWFCPSSCCDPKIDSFGWCCSCQTSAVLVEVKE